MEWGSGSIKDVVINNFYYYITTIIDEKRSRFRPVDIGRFLMVMTFFKTAATYLSSYFMIPLRSGIVRDIRNYVYEKVVSLPIGFFTSEKKGDVMARMSGDVGGDRKFDNGIARYDVQESHYDYCLFGDHVRH